MINKKNYNVYKCRPIRDNWSHKNNLANPVVNNHTCRKQTHASFSHLKVGSQLNYLCRAFCELEFWSKYWIMYFHMSGVWTGWICTEERGYKILRNVQLWFAYSSDIFDMLTSTFQNTDRLTLFQPVKCSIRCSMGCPTELTHWGQETHICS